MNCLQYVNTTLSRAVIFFLLLSSLAFSQVPADNVSRAVRLFGDGRNEEAYRAFFALLREVPDNDTVYLGLARSAMKVRRPHQAIMAYEVLLQRYPSDSKLSLEIAQAYLLSGDKDSAALYLTRSNLSAEDLREFETSLIWISLVSRNKLSAEDLHDLAKRVAKIRSRFELSGRLKLGGSYDSNANSAPAKDILHLGEYQVQIPKSSVAEEAFGYFLAGGLSASYRLSEGRSWYGVGDLNFYTTKRESDILRETNSDIFGYYSADLGIRHTGAKTLFQITGNGDVSDYNFYNTVYSYGGAAAFIYAPLSWLQLLTQGKFSLRSFVRNEANDGAYWYLGEYLRFILGNQEIMIGGRYGDNKPKENLRGRSTLWEGSLSARFRFYSLEVSPYGSYAIESYERPATSLDTEERGDTRLGFGLDVIYHLTNMFSLELGWAYTKNDSNSELYDYEKHTGTVAAGMRF